MRKPRLVLRALCLCLLMAVAGCEKAMLDELPGDGEQTAERAKGAVDVVLRVAPGTAYPYETRAMTDLTEYCSRLNFVFYQNGEKKKALTQIKGEQADFGQVKLALLPGTYKLMVLAHSSYGGNPVLSDPEAIQFTNKLSYSDTFYYYGDLEVNSDTTTHELVLTRATSMVRFEVVDKLPANLHYFHFQYTGGTGVLNVTTGYGGNVDSRQEKKYEVDGYTAPLVMPLYTFLPGDEGQLSIRAAALTKAGDTIAVRQFDHVPIERGKMTVVSGAFFDRDHTLTIKGETAWEETHRITY